MMDEEQRKCTKCGELKGMDNYPDYVTRKGTKLKTHVCKACRNKREREKRDKELTTPCISCGDLWRKSGGETKKIKNLCHSCYPAYRMAYNLHGAAKNRAKKQNLPFDLTVDFIYERIKNGYCNRTGLAFALDGTGVNYRDRHPQTPSIDKIVPALGYTQDNVQVVCWWYNLSKSTFTDEQVIELCKSVVNHAS